MYLCISVYLCIITVYILVSTDVSDSLMCICICLYIRQMDICIVYISVYPTDWCVSVYICILKRLMCIYLYYYCVFIYYIATIWINNMKLIGFLRNLLISTHNIYILYKNITFLEGYLTLNGSFKQTWQDLMGTSRTWVWILKTFEKNEWALVRNWVKLDGNC